MGGVCLFNRQIVSCSYQWANRYIAVTNGKSKIINNIINENYSPEVGFIYIEQHICFSIYNESKVKGGFYNYYWVR